MIHSRAQAAVGRASRHRMRTFGAVATAAMASIALAACGSSKPAYCTDRANLENSIKGLTDISLSSGLSGVQSQFGKIKSDATALVSSAKGDFPSQTDAIRSSVAGL